MLETILSDNLQKTWNKVGTQIKFSSMNPLGNLPNNSFTSHKKTQFPVLDIIQEFDIRRTVSTRDLSFLVLIVSPV